MEKLLKTTVSACVLAFAVTTTSPAIAGGIPTLDVTNLTQMIQQLKMMEQQYMTQLEELNQMRLDYEEALKQVSAMTGTTDLTGITGELTGIQIETAVDGIAEAVPGVLANNPTGEFADSINATIAQFGLEGLGEIADSDKPLERAAAQFAGVSTAAIAAGQAGEVDAANAASRADALRAGIGTQEELKDAVDYNTLVLMEMVDNQAILIQLMSAQLLNDGTADLMAARSAVSGTLLRIKDAP